jgi:L-fucose isomerase-like protein
MKYKRRIPSRLSKVSLPPAKEALGLFSLEHCTFMLTQLKLKLFKSALVPSNATIVDYLSPLTTHFHPTITDDPPSAGEPLVGFCLTGGTEAPFLAAAMAHPKSPAVILVHDRANSFASGCELAARLSSEHRAGRRAPSVFCSIHDTRRLRAILTAASVASRFAEIRPRIGVIGNPSPWLIASGRTASSLPVLWNMTLHDVAMDEFLRPVIAGTPIYDTLSKIVSEYRLNAFTLRCFDLLQYRVTSCLAVSRFNDEGFVAACEGDIAACVTMMGLRTVSGSPVFMANAAGTVGDRLMFAHCTVPKSLCTNTKIETHYESGIGESLCGRVKEG